jgi:hypothetical protein
MSSLPHQAAHLLQPEHAHLAHAHAHGFYGDMTRSSRTPSPSASPRFSARSPTSQPQQLATRYPDDRTPPPRDVSNTTIDDAYAAFILYCNPSFATSTDTSELVKLFRTPPKSDGNAFSSWMLFELIRKFEAKEIKTWTQLALDLGVAPPDTDKGQSTQKVQQYSVRLKRWMRAMHIDAFFEYLLGKQPPYCIQIPPIHDPFPPDGRDGVPLEEDLAIRALDPKFKPKRGRRKADEGDDEMEADEGTPLRKRPQLVRIPHERPPGPPHGRFLDSARPVDCIFHDTFISHDDSLGAQSHGTEEPHTILGLTHVGAADSLAAGLTGPADTTPALSGNSTISSPLLRRTHVRRHSIQCEAACEAAAWPGCVLGLVQQQQLCQRKASWTASQQPIGSRWAVCHVSSKSV